MTCLLQSSINPTCLLQLNDFPTHLYLGSGSLIIGKFACKWCELGKVGKSNTFISLEVQWYNSNHNVPRLIPTVTHSCNEEEWPQCSLQTYINTLGVSHCHIAMVIFVHFALNWTLWHVVPWPLEHNCLNQSDSQIANINITTICTIYMLLDVIWSCVR